MKYLKKAVKIFSLVLVALMLGGCSGASWCVKTQNNTIPAGVYIYYMSTAYSEAYQQVQGSTGSILEQSIGDKNVADWIEEQALNSCKKLLEVEKRFDEMGLSFTDEEIATMNSTADSTWKQYGSLYEKFGVSKESYLIASSKYNLKYQKILENTYSEGNDKNITDDSFKEYFVNNYTNYSYFAKQLINEDEDNTDMSDEQINAIKNKFEEYAEQINNGANFNDVAAKYQQDYSVSSDPKYTDNIDLNAENIQIPSDIKNALKELETNHAKAVTVNKTYYLLVKGDINTALNDVNADEKKRSSMLDNVKEDQLEKDIQTAIDNNSNIKVNKIVIKKYKPSMFEQKATSKATN